MTDQETVFDGSEQEDDNDQKDYVEKLQRQNMDWFKKEEVK